MDLESNTIGEKVFVSADVREYIKDRLSNCFCDAEFYGIGSASWAFLCEMAELAGCDIEEMVRHYNF